MRNTGKYGMSNTKPLIAIAAILALAFSIFIIMGGYGVAEYDLGSSSTQGDYESYKAFCRNPVNQKLKCDADKIVPAGIEITTYDPEYSDIDHKFTLTCRCER